MTLVPVQGVLGIVAQVAEHDEAAAAEWIRLGLYEALCDQIDAAEGTISKDLEAFISKRNDKAREVLVKEFISKRLDGGDVDGVLQAAKIVEVFSKETVKTPDDPKTFWYDARDVLGQFTSAATAFSEERKKDLGPFDHARYSQMRALGAGLAHSSNPTTKGIGVFAGAAGALGPEADKVLRPGLTRIAYRYRGTERRPNKKLKDEIGHALEAVDTFIEKPEIYAARTASVKAEDDQDKVGRSLTRKPYDNDRSSTRIVEEKTSGLQMAQHYLKRSTALSPDQLEMRVAGDVAVDYLARKLSTPEITAISIAAGQVPPSQGILIDADGDVVSESMGYNGDHYLPFDLKNLRSLNGGQYVRSRAVGGPTSEDIYTGLLTGARQIQVVSHSGVFTMEFDPDLRGGKRYSDKARQMVGRYERILDAVANSKESKLYQKDIPEKRKREIASGILRDNPRMNEKDLQTAIDNKVDQERLAGSFKFQSEEEIKEEAEALTDVWYNNKRKANNAPSNQERGRFLEDQIFELTREAREGSVKRFKLDGEGYYAALKALQEEFPYFVRGVDYEPLPKFHDERGMKRVAGYSGATDQGYVPMTGDRTVAASVANKRPLGAKSDRWADRRESDKAKIGSEGDSSDTTVGTRGEGTRPKGASDSLTTDLRVLKRISENMEPTIKNALQTLKEKRVEGKAAMWDDQIDGVILTYPVDQPAMINQLVNGPEKPRYKIRWIQEAADSKSMTMTEFLLDSQTPQAVTDMAATEFPKLVSSIHELGLTLPNAEAVSADAKAIGIIAAMRQPLKTGVSDIYEYDPTARGNGKPLTADGVTSIKHDKEAFEDARAKFISENEQDLVDAIDKYRGLLKNDGYDNMLKDVSAQVDLFVRASTKEEKDRDDAEVKKLKKIVADRQFAAAFAWKEHLVAEYQRLVGAPPVDANFLKGLNLGASMPSSGPVRKSVPLRGSRGTVLLHPPGSQVAEQFRKFLAAQPKT